MYLVFVGRLQEGRLLVAAGALKVVQLPDVFLQLLLSFLLGSLLLGPNLHQSTEPCDHQQGAQSIFRWSVTRA